MAKTKISEFSATPGNNTDIDGINIAEGCAPSGINDAIRELMSQLKDFQAGTAGDSFNGPVGTTTAAAGAFTTLSASSTVSGTGFSNYLASPPAIGGTAAAAGSFTTLTTSSTVTHNGGTANGVAYLNGSKVLTTGSDLAFDGTNFLKVFRTTGFYAWGSGYKGLITDRTSLVSASSSSVTTTHLASNLYFDDTVWRYSSATNAKGSSLTQNNGTLAFYATAAAGSSGNVATTTTLFSVDNTGRGTFADTVVLSGGTANGVAYLNGSKVLTTGSALTFDGSTFSLNGANGTSDIRVYNNTNASSSGYSRFILKTLDQEWRVINDSTTAGYPFTIYNATSGYAPYKITNGDVSIWSIGATEGMRLTSTGLGIGTSSPAAKLHVSGDAIANTFKLIANTTVSGSDATIFRPADNTMAFSTNGLERMRLDSSGNLGLGVTPSAWYSSVKVLQVGTGSMYSTTTTQNTLFSANEYLDSSANPKYIVSDYASRYQQYSGQHRWYTAPSGTAGNAITFTQAMTLDASGNLVVADTTAAYSSSGRGNITIGGSSSGLLGFRVGGVNRAYVLHDGTDWVLSNTQSGALIFNTNSTERARIDSSGNLLVNSTSSTGQHVIAGRTATDGTLFLSLMGTTSAQCAYFYYVNSGDPNAANTAIKVWQNTTTTRSINAKGTINASGADYAEYMTKASDFSAAKGDVVGVDANGKLTNVFVDAVSFVVKSTNPSYVGGDTWGDENAIGKRPDESAPQSEKDAFNAKLEAARQTVDRIAFAGQVPVNVMGASAGQYIVPMSDNGAIKGVAKNEADLTMSDYIKAVGKVIAVEADGRARIIVKVA